MKFKNSAYCLLTELYSPHLKEIIVWLSCARKNADFTLIILIMGVQLSSARNKKPTSITTGELLLSYRPSDDDCAVLVSPCKFLRAY